MKYIKFSEWAHIPHYLKELMLGKIIVDEDKCTGCGFCARACPGNALEVIDKKARMVTHELPQCISCGDCMAICPEGAVEVAQPTVLTGYYKTINKGELAPPRLFTSDDVEGE